MTLKRRLLVNIHVWLGLLVGGLWALQGLTGAMLAFNRDVQPMLLSQAPEGRRSLPLEEIFARAGEAAEARVEMLETFTPKPHLLLAYYKDGSERTRQLVIDARTGQVLDKRDPEVMTPSGGSTWYWLLRLHESLLAGENGLYFTGASGMLLFSSVIMGLWLGFPRRKQWKHVFDFPRWRNTAQKLFGWHRMIGLSLGAMLLLSAVCGAYLAFAPILRPALASAGLYVMPFKPDPVDELAPSNITAQRALDIARSHFPNAVMVRSTLPTKKSPVYGFRLLQDGEWRRWAGTTTIFIDPASGQVLSVYDPLTAPFFNRLNDNIYPTHTGEAGGPVLRILLFLGGLALPTLYVTGVWAWLRRRHRRAVNLHPRSFAADSA